MHWIL